MASPVYASEAPVAEIEAVVPNLATEAGTVEKQNPVNLLSPKQDVSNLADGVGLNLVAAYTQKDEPDLVKKSGILVRSIYNWIHGKHLLKELTEKAQKTNA